MSNIIKSARLRKTPVIIEYRMPEPCVVPENPEITDAGEPDEAAAEEIAVSPAEEALQEALAKAEEIVARAQDEAADIIRETSEEAERLKADAREEGFQQGHQDGFNQGKEEGRQEGFSEVASTLEEAVGRAERLMALAQEEAAAMLTSAERQMVELSVAVARKILSREIEENPMAVLPIVQAALNRVRDQEQVSLRVNPEDYEVVLQARRELQSLLKRESKLTIQADTNLKNGDCVIETPYGAIDARIDTQLELIKTALKDMVQ
ncbi:MAG TPA: flagellar assembly protein FliH [Selenomonadales bacterium]|nr:flagellar assembly protein FliH [Selenomonadales bacterium]